MLINKQDKNRNQDAQINSSYQLSKDQNFHNQDDLEKDSFCQNNFAKDLNLRLAQNDIEIADLNTHDQISKIYKNKESISKRNKIKTSETQESA